MAFMRLTAGRPAFVFGSLLTGLLLLAGGGGGLAVGGAFPFDQELLLDAKPMRPAKRVPILHVRMTGAATIDLWCRTVKGRVELAPNNEIRISPEPLPEDLPRYMSAGQCTPERIDADYDMLVALMQATSWQRQGDMLVLRGDIKTLRFRLSTH